jgi:hypothetical protein
MYAQFKYIAIPGEYILSLSKVVIRLKNSRNSQQNWTAPVAHVNASLASKNEKFQKEIQDKKSFHL